MTRGSLTGRAVGAGGVAAASQVLGLAQLALLLRGGAGGASDAYFYVLAWATIPIQLVLVSTMYPMILRGRGTNWRSLTKYGGAVAALTVAFTTVGAVVYGATGNKDDGLWVQSALLCISTLASVPAWVGALVLAAHGRPGWLSGINLMPSLIAVPSMVVVTNLDLYVRVSVLLCAQAVGFAMYSVMTMRALKRAGALHVDGHTHTQPDGRGWFVAQSVSAYGSIIAIQTAGAYLPTSGITVLGVVTRVVGAGTSLVTNAVLPLLVNAQKRSAKGTARYSALILVGGALGMIAIFASSSWFPEDYGKWMFGLPVWATVILVNAALHRVAFVASRPSLSLVTIVASPLVAVSALLVVPQRPSFSLVLLCFVALEAVSAVPYAMALKQWRIAAALVALLLAYVLMTWVR